MAAPFNQVFSTALLLPIAFPSQRPSQFHLCPHGVHNKEMFLCNHDFEKQKIKDSKGPLSLISFISWPMWAFELLPPKRKC